MKFVNNLIYKYNYLRFRTNWHQIFWLSKLCCYLGRHDYEARKENLDQYGVELYCFYCQHKKFSFFTREN